MRAVLKVALVAAVLAAPTGAMSDEKGDVKYRQAIMKGIAGHAGAIAQIANGKVAHDGDLAAHASALVALTKMVPSAFKNEAGVGDSGAKAEVWSDWAGFDGEAGSLERAANAVNAAAASGPAAVKATLGDLFDSCKSCHKGYREKKS